MDRFFTINVEPSKRLNEWRDIISHVYFNLDVVQVGDQVQGEVSRVDLGDLSITSYRSNRQRNIRTKQSISANPEDAYAFIMPVSTSFQYVQCGRNGVLEPDSGVLLNAAEYYEIRCPDGYMNVTIKIPGAQLRSRLPHADDYCARESSDNHAMVRLVRSHALGLAALDEQASTQRSGLASNLVDLVVLALTSGRQGSETDRQNQRLLMRRLTAYIRDNCTDVELSPTIIAQENGVSLSYLHKLFAKSGLTVNGFIMESRLHEAYQHLTEPRFSFSTVEDIGFKAGFKSSSHFSRSFKSKYGFSPSEAKNFQP